MLVGWEAQHLTACKAVAEPTEQSKRLWMIFRICSPACLAAGCEETSLAQPFRIEAPSCYMKHLKWRARWECRLNPPFPQNSVQPSPNTPFKNRTGQKRCLEPLCADDFSTVSLMFQLLIRLLHVCHPCPSFQMLKREEATRWLMRSSEHVSSTA